MKKCLFSILTVFSLLIIFSCTPLMNDLENGDGKSYYGGGYTTNNDVDIVKVVITDAARLEDAVFAKVLDAEGKLVDGKITYQWQYQKASGSNWIDIEGATQSIYEVGKEVINIKTPEPNRLRVVITKNNVTLESKAADLYKGLIDPDSVKVDMPFAPYGSSIEYSEYLTPNTVSAKSYSGKDVEIRSVENEYTESEKATATKKIPIIIYSDYYEDFYSSDFNDGYLLKVKQRTPKEYDVTDAVFSYDAVNNVCSFKYWAAGKKYSYDDGLTWCDEPGSFTPLSRYILVVKNGINYDSLNDVWEVYPSDAYMYTFKTAKFNVVNFTLDQADLELTFDETTGTLTMEEGYGEYIWFVKSGWHPEQDVMMINQTLASLNSGVSYGIDPAHPNKFNLAKFFEEMPEDELEGYREGGGWSEPWPEYGRPGKYYIQAVALTSPIFDSLMSGLPTISLSSTCWVELQ